MNRQTVGWLVISAIFASLLGLVAWGTVAVAQQEGLGTALAIVPGMPVGALALYIIMSWAIRATIEDG